MKNAVIAILVAALAVSAYFLIRGSYNRANVMPSKDEVSDIAKSRGETEAEETRDMGKGDTDQFIIGKSVENREIVAYHYGSGNSEILFVGGVHGGYEWNTTLFAYELIDYLKENPGLIPIGLKITVVPILNPDGLFKVVGAAGRFTGKDVSVLRDKQISGRFNANNVDLNRNFDCDWQPSGVWQNKAVSGGSAAFSEPESQAVKKYIETKKPRAVVVWYSAAGGVFASSCHNGVLPETSAIMRVYAKASGYPASESFDFYEITGDMVNWLAKNKIPAVSVLLSTHNDVEWDRNLAGVKALLAYYRPAD